MALDPPGPCAVEGFEPRCESLPRLEFLAAHGPVASKSGGLTLRGEGFPSQDKKEPSRDNRLE